MHVRLAPLLPAALLASALGLTAGCTSTHDSPGPPEAGDSPTASTSRAPSDVTDSPSAPTSSSSAPAAPVTALVDRLLPTGEVPGLNASWKWQDGDTGTATAEPFGLCAKADLLSIGAGEVVARTYFPPDDSDDNAAEQVAEFPDARTARLAWSVLGSWHDRCGSKRSQNPGLVVSRVAPHPVSTGSARYYLLSWTPAGEEVGRYEELGMVLDGTRIAVLRIDYSTRNPGYPPGKEPMVGMVTAAAGWLD